jgi:hypothetical protein
MGSLQTTSRSRLLLCFDYVLVYSLHAFVVTSYLEQAVWRTPEGANGIEALPLGAPDGDNEKVHLVAGLLALALISSQL